MKIGSGEDIAHLGELDQKLWTVLSCPVDGLEFDRQTLEFLDADKDGKIMVKEVVKAAEWLTSVIKDKDRPQLAETFNRYRAEFGLFRDWSDEIVGRCYNEIVAQAGEVRE